MSLPLLLDELAGNAWPGIVQQYIEGWRLRAAENVTRRGNSVLPTGTFPTYAGWLEDIERFYTDRNLLPRYQVSDASAHGLDTMLADRGYRVEAPTSIMVADASDLLGLTGSGEVEVAADSRLQDSWLDAFLRIEGYEPIKREAYRRIYLAIGPRARYVSIYMDGEAAGIGLGVTERGWTGLFSIATAPEHRRKGISTAIIRALSEWSLQSGAPGLYLQVNDSNEAAGTMYNKLGFRRLYGYHYRTR